MRDWRIIGAPTRIDLSRRPLVACWNFLPASVFLAHFLTASSVYFSLSLVVNHLHHDTYIAFLNLTFDLEQRLEALGNGTSFVEDGSSSCDLPFNESPTCGLP